MLILIFCNDDYYHVIAIPCPIVFWKIVQHYIWKFKFPNVTISSPIVVPISC